MKKSNGARKSVLSYIRPESYYEGYIPSAIAKPTGKPGKKRKVVGSGAASRGGEWVGVMPV
jgi:hypothetical protein